MTAVHLPRRDGRLVHEAIWAPMFAFGVLFAVVLPELVPRIPCMFRSLTGLPCMTCGSTRAVLRLAHFDPLGAFVMNPLFTVLAGAGLLYVLHSAAVLLGWRRPWTIDGRSPAFRRGRWVIGIAVLANWVYLIGAGR